MEYVLEDPVEVGKVGQGVASIQNVYRKESIIRKKTVHYLSELVKQKFY